MNINFLQLKLIGIIGLLAFVVAVAGCTQKTESKETQTTEVQKVETAPVEKAAPVPQASLPSFKTYRHQHYNIDYPSDWSIVDMTDGDEAFTSGSSGPDDELNEKVIVSVDPENIYTNIDQVVSVSLKELKVKYPDLRMLENTKTTLAKQPARKIAYTFEDEDLQVFKIVQIMALKDTKSYLITYGGQGEDFDNYWPYAQKMFDSFVMK